MNYRLFILVLGTFIIGTDDFVIAGILPSIAEDLDVSIVAAGQLVTAFALAYAIGAPVLGTLAFNLPLKRLLILSMLVFTVSNGLSAIVPSFEWLFVTRILAALSASLFTPLAMAASARLVPESKRGKALSFITVGITLGLILGAPIGTWIGNVLNWRYSFLLVTIMSLITTIGIMMILPTIEREETVSLKTRLRSLNSQVLLTLTVSIIATIGGFATYTYIAPILNKITTLHNISWFLLLFGIGSLFGNLIGGYGTDRIGASTTLKMSLGGFSIILISFSLLTLLTPGYTTIVLASIVALLWGIPGFALNPALNSYLISLNPSQASMTLSFSASALYLGIGLGAIIGGGVIRVSSIDYVGLVSGILVGIALVMFMVIQKLCIKKQ
ncbi:MAG: MFS transporter [Bacillota bacterium]